jgi:hypothetical protein
MLGALGFQDIVDVYHAYLPPIAWQPFESGVAYLGITEAWVIGERRTSTIKLRTDIEQCPAMLAAVLAHELLHVRQFAQQPEVYANCFEREVPAYKLEVAVLKAWCAANPQERYGLPVTNYYLMSMADENRPESLESFARRGSCGMVI